LPGLVKFGSKLVLEIMPSVAATVIGGYLLTQLHFSHTPEPTVPQPTAAAAVTTSTPDVPTVREDRAAMREVLKDRRENPEQPAVVRQAVSAAPVAAPAPANTPANPPETAAAPANPPAPVPAQLPAAMDSISPSDQAVHAAPATRPAVVATPVLPRARPDSVATVYAPAPPPGLPQAPALGVDAPMQVAPVAPAAPAGPMVASPAQPPLTPDAPPQRHGVFSTLSGFVGTAASATGHTVNWMIDLPGKAIDAGGRVIGINPAPPPNRPFS